MLGYWSFVSWLWALVEKTWEHIENLALKIIIRMLFTHKIGIIPFQNNWDLLNITGIIPFYKIWIHQLHIFYDYITTYYIGSNGGGGGNTSFLCKRSAFNRRSRLSSAFHVLSRICFTSMLSKVSNSTSISVINSTLSLFA